MSNKRIFTESWRVKSFEGPKDRRKTVFDTMTFSSLDKAIKSFDKLNLTKGNPIEIFPKGQIKMI